MPQRKTEVWQVRLVPTVAVILITAVKSQAEADVDVTINVNFGIWLAQMFFRLAQMFFKVVNNGLSPAQMSNWADREANFGGVIDRYKV